MPARDGALPFWDSLRQRAGVRSTLVGVVGIPLAAPYDPVWTGAIHSRADFGLGLAAFGLLVYARASPHVAVAFAAGGGWLLGAN